MEYVKTPPHLARLCESLAREPRLAIDTEFVGENSYFPRLEIVQLAAPGVEAIIDYRDVSGGGAEARALQPLWELFADPARELVFHAAGEDLRILKRLMGAAPPNVFDTQVAYSFVDRRLQVGYANLVSEVVGKRLDKGAQMLDWSRRPLSDSQIAYAIEDVRYLFPLREKILAMLERAGRLAWYREEQAELLAAVPGDPDPEEAWRGVKRSGSLARDEFAVLRTVAAWREEAAMDADTLASRILPDDVVIAIARARPRTVAALERTTRRLTRGQIDRLGDGIVRAVRRGMDDPPPRNASLPPPAPSPHVKGLAALLNAYVEARAQELEMATPRIVRSSELSDLAEDPNAPLVAELPVMKGWRRETIGEELLAIVRGEMSLHWNLRDKRLETVARDADALAPGRRTARG